MNKVLISLQEEGYAIMDIIKPGKFGSSIHYYIPQSVCGKFKNSVMYVLIKNNKILLIAEEG